MKKTINSTETLRYTVFKTGWGYFGIVGLGGNLVQTYLPMKSATALEKIILTIFTEKYRLIIEQDECLFKPVQKRIISYFNGEPVDFADVPIALPENLSEFSRQVLACCRKIKFGQVLTYSQLAQKATRPKAARAVGNILSKNRLPLIIGCHRIIRNDGKPGGFTAPGGLDLKLKLLDHEKHNR
jgi:methylated-DNA-[protein]-cysteine S-methyltransferase